MPYTDSIRSKARKTAWYNDDPNVKSYNIFGRVKTNSVQHKDVESGRALTHVSSEGDADSPGAAARRKEFGNIGDSRRVETFPASPIDDKTIQNGGYHREEPVPAPAASEHKPTMTTRLRKVLHMSNKDNDQNGDLEHTGTRQKSKRKRGKKYKKIPFGSQLKAVFASWINVLLIFVPIGLGIEYSNVNGILSFVMNFIAIVPLAAILSFATEELAYYVGDTFGGLLNATFGNATEVIVSIIALLQRKVIIVKTSLIGSMLSNLLLVLGMCFFFGGLNRMEQFFNITVAQTAASLLALAIGALVTPTAFRIFSDNDDGVGPLSHAASLLLLLTYAAYLFFQLRTHITMYNEPSQKVEKKNLLKKPKKDDDVDVTKGTLTAGTSAAAAAGRPDAEKPDQDAQADSTNNGPEEEEHVPQLSATGALITLAIATALIAVTSDGMVSGIDSLPKDKISEEFVGLILVPIVGNAAEHATAVTVAIKDKMDLAIGVAVGSSLQIALLVIPLIVVVFWCGAGQPLGPNDAPMDLNFDGFQIVVLFIAVILVNYVIQDGRSHWLEGVMLFITYMIFAVAAWYVKGLKCNTSLTYFPGTTRPSMSQSRSNTCSITFISQARSIYASSIAHSVCDMLSSLHQISLSHDGLEDHLSSLWCRLTSVCTALHRHSTALHLMVSALQTAAT